MLDRFINFFCPFPFDSFEFLDSVLFCLGEDAREFVLDPGFNAGLDPGLDESRRPDFITLEDPGRGRLEGVSTERLTELEDNWRLNFPDAD